jgi:dienelactone hydrolase
MFSKEEFLLMPERGQHMQLFNNIFRYFHGLLVGTLLTNVSLAANGQGIVHFTPSPIRSHQGAETVEARYSHPNAQVVGVKVPAVVLLHSAWGWADEHEGSSAYAQALQEAGFYPMCWILKANAQGRKSPVPASAWLEWSGMPIRIFAGANDDYDNRDPKACENAVSALPEAQQRGFSVRVYSEATHGWDQRMGATFFEKLACNGRGCNNTNLPNKQITELSVKELTGFMSTNLAQ